MTQEAADRIKEAEMKKPNPDYELIRRTQEAAKRNQEESPMTQEAADRIKEAEMKKPNPDYEFIRRTQEAAKRNEGK